MRWTGRRPAAADQAEEALRPGSPEERLQSAFTRIARARAAYEKQVSPVFQKNELELLQEASVQEREVADLERQRRELFERFPDAGSPGPKEGSGRSPLYPSHWVQLLSDFSRLLDGFLPENPEEWNCAYDLAELLTEMGQAAPPDAVSPAYAEAAARLEEIAEAFAAFDAKQAEVLADPALGADEKQTRLAEWAFRQYEYATRRLADDDG